MAISISDKGQYHCHCELEKYLKTDDKTKRRLFVIIKTNCLLFHFSDTAVIFYLVTL